jgi:hypothetical protein
MEERVKFRKAVFGARGPENKRDLYQNQFTGERHPGRTSRPPEGVPRRRGVPWD